jgi:hypothetical protein
MISEVPVASDPAQSFTTQLGPRKIQFDLRWNDRASVWVMDLTDDATGSVLLRGIPLVLGCDLLEPYNLGLGRLVVIDTSRTNTDASYDDLGTRVKLYWLSADEVPAP